MIFYNLKYISCTTVADLCVVSIKKFSKGAVIVEVSVYEVMEITTDGWCYAFIVWWVDPSYSSIFVFGLFFGGVYSSVYL